jgi:hypothetical protein
MVHGPAEMHGPADNPVLHIEELTRLPLRRRPLAPPGSAQVYLGRSGRLYAPTGGLTARELLRLAPRRVYDVDLTPHPLETTCELTGEAEQPRATVAVTALWRTISPVAVVTHQVFDVAAIAQPHLLSLLRGALAGVEWASGEDLAGILDGQAFPSVNLPEGICVYQIRASVPGLVAGHT